MNDDDTRVEWAAARAENRDNWDERVPLHEEAYALRAFDEPTHLSEVVRDDLVALAPYLPGRSVAGLDICHLQCHIGSDTLSLVRAGARVTGVDFSPPALASAARLAERLGLEATWVETDVLDARAAVVGDFDVVYTSIGTVTWLPDLTRWAQQIVELLRDGGTFFIRDGHPSLYSIDENADGLVLRHPYFGDGSAQVWNEEKSYVGDGTLEHSRTYEWAHPLSEILTALIASGLRIIHVAEGRTLPWLFSPRMVEVPGGYAWPEGERNLVPCTYTIIARKP